MKKPHLFSAIILFAAITAPLAHADPCGAELCLSNLAVAKSLQECKKEINDFFSIKKKKHGAFSPYRTYKARYDYLNKCASGNTQEKARILSKYGYILKP